jgi:predicted metal-binding membrane protein
VSTGSLIEGVLRRDRLLVVLGLTTVIVAAWAYLLSGAGMSMHEMDGMLMPMHNEPWTPGYALLMFAMWAVMMAAMMLPSAAPMILLYSTIARARRARDDVAIGSGVFAAGYLLVWAAFSLGAAGLQFAAVQAAVVSPMMEMTSTGLAGALLIVAGLYQWSPLKQACLQRCRSPLEFMTTRWREGAWGAFTMGLSHGAYCLGCCWVLMLLLFVGGVMNLIWIAGLALFVLIEKTAPAGHWIGRAAGIALMVWGAVTLTAL